MDDSRIIELFFERSEQAIAELSKKYGMTALRVAGNILGSREDAEECVNDAYLAVWNTVPPQSPDPLRAYVLKVVRNLAIKKYEAKTALKRNSFYDVALDEIAECFPAPGAVEERLEAKEVAGMINSFLGTLNSRDRVIFVRRYWHSDSPRTIAEMLGKRENYISVRLSRIRRELRKYLAKEGVSL